MFGVRWDSGLLRSLGQALTAVLFAAMFVLIPPQVPQALAVQADGSDSVVDYALNLNGSSDYASNSGVVMPQGDFFVGAWVREDVGASDVRAIVSQGISGNVNFSFELRLLSSGGNRVVQLYRAGGAPANNLISSVVVPQGQWSHVGVSYDDTAKTHTIFLNGVAAQTWANSENVNDFAGQFFVGLNYFCGCNWFDGQLDEVTVWNSTKTATQVSALMHSRASGSDLVAYWDFNEPSGATAFDRKGSANLSLFGSPIRTDVKQVTVTSGGDTIVTFPRTYLPGVGGWTPPVGITTAQLLLVGGGGGGSGNSSAGSFQSAGGAGGGGGVLQSSSVGLASPSVVIVGTGGLGGVSVTTNAGASGFRGQSSAFRSLTAGGGGAGGCEQGVRDVICSTAKTSGGNGTAAGSGGSPSYFWNAYSPGDKGVATATVMDGITYPAVQGRRGGFFGDGGTSTNNSAGSGGGALGSGTRNTPGDGQSSAISGAALSYGGGGAAWDSSSWVDAPPIANRGTGGNGAFSTSPAAGYAGSAGVVILRYSLAPGAPTGLVATQTTTHATINLSWTAPSVTGESAITDYDIEYRPSGGQWTSYSDGVSTATSAAVQLPQQCIAHEFRVIAKNSGFNSVASAIASATPVWGTFESLTGVQISSSNSQCVVTFNSVGSHTWSPPTGTTAVTALVVGGGGGGGSGGDSVGAGGGGAGGFIETIATSLPSGPLRVFVGAGGARVDTPHWQNGRTGQSSIFNDLTAFGGGGGGGRMNQGLSGASGGGSGGRSIRTGALGSDTQGKNGGSVTAEFIGGSGGGGAASAGGNASASTGGAGGAGSFSNVIGSVLATGGSGGPKNLNTDGVMGSPNTGNGGGGGGGTGPQANGVWSYGGTGGSGIVAIRQLSIDTPVISSHPTSTSLEAGSTHTFNVSATAIGTLSYQWQSSADGNSWTNVGANSPSFTTPALRVADNGTQYRVIVTNNLNGDTSEVTSNVATISVTGVTITAGACSAMVGSDTGVTISETANGACLVQYTEPGSSTFKVPNLVSSIQAFIVGGGGGGGGARLGEGGGGGGGGAASRVVTLAVTGSQVVPLTVAAGGNGGNPNTNGFDGGSTSISSSFVVNGGRGGKAANTWPGGGGPGGTGADGILVSSGASGGAGATDPGNSSWYQPRFGNAGNSRIFAGELWCTGGGAGGGNREVANDAFFHWEPRSQFCSDGVTKSGGSGGWHNGTTNVLPTSGLANRGGGGGGGSYNSTLNIARAGAKGADGVVAILFVPATGNISLTNLGAVSFSDTTHAITLTKDNSTTDVTWTTSNVAICSIASSSHTGATIQEESAGLCEVSVVVAANQAESFGRGTAATSFQIDKISRSTPTWSNGVTSVNVPFGSSLDLRPRLSQPGESYTFSTSGTANSCTVTGYTLNVGNVGDTCNVTPTLLGTNIYLDMVGTTPLAVTVTKISQSALVLTSATSMNVNQTLTLSAAGGSGTGALSYLVANQGTTGCVANPTTGALTATGAGQCEVYAQRALSNNYDAVTSSHVIVTINKVAQNLSWVSQPQAQYVAGNTYALEATASSQLAVAYSISSGLCTLAGNTVTFTGSGDCVIQAGQPGDNSFLPAVTISQTVSVGKINQTMTFSVLADKSWGSLAFSLSATASSGLNIVYSENNQTTNDACDVSANGIVTIKNVGTCAITATQAGDSAHTAVTTTRLFEVTANQAGAPFIGSVSFGDRQLNASFFTPSYLGGGTISAFELRAYELNGTLASTNTGCIANQGATQSCSVIGLDNGKKYVLKVAAITQAGRGEFSASSSEIIPAANPEAVGNLIAIEGNGTLSLQWTEPTSFGGGSFFEYRIYWRAPGQQYQGDNTPGARVTTQSSTTFVITGLNNGVAYDVKIVTATFQNNFELQSNTAEVRQTPFTVPDAPAAVVALDNDNNVVVAWQPPVFDGGNPIDQYVVKKGTSTVCTITSATTTSCEIARPAPGTTEVIEVRAGNDAGLSAPVSTTITVAALPGTNPPAVIGGGISLPGVTPVAVAPTVVDVSGSAVVRTNDLVRLVGTNLNLVQKVLIGSTEASFFVNSAGLITIRIPMEVAAGKPTITLQGAFGSRIFTGLIEVSLTQVSIDTKVTIGTFLGYAAIYTKNHEGKRLSMRIGNKWRVIDPLSANYTRNLTKVGVGRTVTVMVYLDRKLVQVKQIKIQ